MEYYYVAFMVYKAIIKLLISSMLVEFFFSTITVTVRMYEASIFRESYIVLAIFFFNLNLLFVMSRHRIIGYCFVEKLFY